MRYSFVASVVAIVAVSATTIPEVGPYAGASSVLLRPRQATTNAGACDSLCTPVQTQVTSCGTDTTCLCTSSIAQALQACAKCGAAQAPSSATMLQNSLTQYSGGCQAAGKPVGTLTIGAVDSSAPASTGAASTPASTPAGVSTSRAASTPLVASTPGASTSRPLSVAQFSSSSPTSTRPLTGVPTGTAAANPVGGAGSGSAAAPGAKASVLGMGLVTGVAAAFVGLF